MGASTELSGDSFQALVDEVHDFVDRVHRERLSDHVWLERMRQAGRDLSSRLADVSADVAQKQAEVAARMQTLSSRLHAYAEALSEHPNIQSLRERRESLTRSYEEFLFEMKRRRVSRAAALAQSLQLKPKNYARNLFHVANATTAVVLYHFFLTKESALLILGTIFSVFAILEITRRFSDRWNDFLVDKVFGAISRPSERYRVNSATVYLLALILITYFFPKVAVESAILVLGFGDPVASLAGKRWGKKKLFRDKSYAGTLAFFIVSDLVVGGWLAAFGNMASTLVLVGTAAAVALVGAVTELLSSRVDDNFSIPIACAIAAAVLL